MATTFVDQNPTVEQDQPEGPKAGSKLKHTLRTLLAATPLILFLVAIPAALGFYVTLQPFLGYLALGLVAASVLLIILMALFVPAD